MQQSLEITDMYIIYLFIYLFIFSFPPACALLLEFCQMDVGRGMI